ncbi:MAG: twin-arginine translocase TatA/TatE family subunit [Firmicutes bacterium]|nr:twin-arginine translocase TatA/TatE family subunit [Bacillota bacterium]
MAWLGFSEIVVIMFLVLILFGPKKMPEIGRLIGSGMKELRKFSDMNLEAMLTAEESKDENKLEIPEKLTESPDPAALAALDPGNAPAEAGEAVSTEKPANETKAAEPVQAENISAGEHSEIAEKSAPETVDPEFDEKQYPDNIRKS